MPSLDPEAAVFVPQGAEFLPTEHAISPWGTDRLHGGPVLGLLTRAIEHALAADGWQPTRLTFDIFRPVPRSALRVHTELVRSGGRLRLLSASLFGGGVEVARASGLSLRAGATRAGGPRFGTNPSPAGPDGFATEGLLRGKLGSRLLPHGFHSVVETRWLPQGVDQPLGIWFRMPLPLVAGEPTSDFQRAAALSDFCNAVASLSAQAARRSSPPYINTDTSVYLARRPHGEWICLLEERGDEQDGVSLTQTALCDVQGCFARCLQARVANG